MRTVLMGVVLCLLLAGCELDYRHQGKEALELCYGTLENRQYTHKTLELKAQLPTGWHPQEDAIYKRLDKAAKELKTKEDFKKYKETLEQMPVHNLVQAFKNQPSEKPIFNPSIVMITSSLEGQNLKSAKDYLELTRTQMQSRELPMGFKQKLDAPIVEFEGNALKWASLPTTMDIEPEAVFQDYYACFVKGQVIAVMGSYQSEDDKKAIENYIKSIEIQ